MLHFQTKETLELMTKSDVALPFKINMSSVHNWTKKGKHQPYGIEGRVYYALR